MGIVELLPMTQPAAKPHEKRSNDSPLKERKFENILIADESGLLDYSAMKEHEKKKVKENTDSEPNRLLWKATPDNSEKTRNIQTEEIHP